MDKKDITYIIAAFAIILVIAFVIKPIATGQPVNTGISFATPLPSSDGHTPCDICKYYRHHYNNPAYTSPDMEPEGPDHWLCQSRKRITSPPTSLFLRVHASMRPNRIPTVLYMQRYRENTAEQPRLLISRFPTGNCPTRSTQ